MDTYLVLVQDLYTLLGEKEEHECGCEHHEDHECECEHHHPSFKEQLEEITKEDVVMQGWVRTNRDNGQIGFIELNDGSCFKNIQLVYDANVVKDYKGLTHVGTGASLEVLGRIVLTPEAKQPFELQVKEYRVLGEVDPDYPLQKKRHSLEFLREIAHLRPRANTFNAVFRMRNAMSMAIHEFFQQNGFMYVHTPIITAKECCWIFIICYN